MEQRKPIGRWSQFKTTIAKIRGSDKNAQQQEQSPLTPEFIPMLELASHIPLINVEPAVGEPFLQMNIPSNKDDENRCFYVGNRASCVVTSTYPTISGKRSGDPICDCAAVTCMSNRIVACIADGCNWGSGPKEAAQKAVRSFIEFVTKNGGGVQDTRDAAHLLIAAFSHSNSMIVPSLSNNSNNSNNNSSNNGNANDVNCLSESWLHAGTTTLLGVVAMRVTQSTAQSPVIQNSNSTPVSPLFPLSSSNANNSTTKQSTPPSPSPLLSSMKPTPPSPSPLLSTLGNPTTTTTTNSTLNTSKGKQSGGNAVEADKWAVVCCSVGDCKLFRVSAADGTVSEITAYIRSSARDTTDPGGRLGVGPDGKTSAPDLRNMQIFYSACEEGDLILLATDGVHDNLDPQLLGMTPIDAGASECSGTWGDLDASWANRVKIAHVNRILHTMIGNTPYSSVELCKNLNNYVEHITGVSKAFMENNPPGTKLPEDYIHYPGKLDHATLLCAKLETTVYVHEEQNCLPHSGFFRLGDIGAGSLREAHSAEPSLADSPTIQPATLLPFARSHSSDLLKTKKPPTPTPTTATSNSSDRSVSPNVDDIADELQLAASLSHPWQRIRGTSTEKVPRISPQFLTSPRPPISPSLHRISESSTNSNSTLNTKTPATTTTTTTMIEPKGIAIELQPNSTTIAMLASSVPDNDEGCSRAHQHSRSKHHSSKDHHHHSHSRPSSPSLPTNIVVASDDALNDTPTVSKRVRKPHAIYPSDDINETTPNTTTIGTPPTVATTTEEEKSKQQKESAILNDQR